MIYEWRTYEALPGKLPDLHTWFATHTLRLFAKHGMESIGYWTEVFGVSNRLVYMLGYPGLGEQERSWAGLLTDADWQTSRAESDKSGTLVAKAYNCILRPTAYSPRG